MYRILKFTYKFKNYNNNCNFILTNNYYIKLLFIYFIVSFYTLNNKKHGFVTLNTNGEMANGVPC